MRPSGTSYTTARTVAQAKVNLFLRVLAREASGYHQLETLFCRLDIGDDVVVRTDVQGRHLECVGPAMPPGGLGPVEQNLAWRAAAGYADATGWPNDWSIEIAKHIPVGGGLGGGSADAGAVLRCLNALAPTPISNEALLAVASPLGADVPFLATETPLAVAWGRGERLFALPALPGRDVALVCFPFGVLTPEAYRWLDDDRGAQLPEASFLMLDQLATWRGVADLAHNDFESVVAARLPTSLTCWLRCVRSSTREMTTPQSHCSPARGRRCFSRRTLRAASRSPRTASGCFRRGLPPVLLVSRCRASLRPVGAPSSNGKTTAFGAVNRGSIPRGAMGSFFPPPTSHHMAVSDRFPVRDNEPGARIDAAIGNTPVVRLTRVTEPDHAEVWVKIEGMNPGGSIKDRTALGMIVDAERRRAATWPYDRRADFGQYGHRSRPSGRRTRVPVDAVSPRADERGAQANVARLRCAVSCSRILSDACSRRSRRPNAFVTRRAPGWRTNSGTPPIPAFTTRPRRPSYGRR